MYGPIEDLLTSEEFDENGWVRMIGFRWQGSQLICDLCVDEGLAGRPLSSWQISCEEVRDYLIVDVNGGGLAIDDGDHPVVRQHTDPQVDPSFRHAATDPMRLIGDLWKAHRLTCDDWIPFDRYLNKQVPLDELLRAESAMLAQGPRFLLEAYAAALQGHNLMVSLSTERPVRHFVDGKWRDQ